MRVAEHAVRNSVGNGRPGLSVIRGLVGKRVANVHLVKVDTDVSRPRVVARSLDVAHRSPLGKIRNVFCDVGPVFPAVSRDLHVTVVGSRPDHTCLFRRFRDRKNGSRIFHADVVRRQAARDLHAARVVARQVRADDSPAIAAVGGDVHVLAAHINLVVVVRRNGHRKFPVEPVLHLGGGGSGDVFRPHFHFSRLMISLIETRDGAPYAA